VEFSSYDLDVRGVPVDPAVVCAFTARFRVGLAPVSVWSLRVDVRAQGLFELVMPSPEASSAEPQKSCRSLSRVR